MSADVRKRSLMNKWISITEEGSDDALIEFSKEFFKEYGQFFDPEFYKLNDMLDDESPKLAYHPENLLQAWNKLLKSLCAEVIVKEGVDILETIATVLKCLVIICRNNDNVSTVASCDCVGLVVTCTQASIKKLYGSEGKHLNSDQITLMTSFIKLVLYFFECLYDPYFVWRKRLKGWSVDVEQLLSKPALVHNEVIPFFHECFQIPSLSGEVQLRLLHMFGAVMSGSLTNGTMTITPATLDVLLSVLSGKSACCSKVSMDLRQQVRQVILQLVVAMVHTIHACSPDQRQVEVPDVLANFMSIVSGLDQEQESDLVIAMIEAVGKMTLCNDKLALQTVLACDFLLEGLISVLKKSATLGAKRKNLAKAVVQAVHALLAGCKHSKDVFEECVGYEEFLEALQNCGEPEKDLLQSLLDLVIETNDESSGLCLIRNPPAAVILMKWLESIHSPALQAWLSEEMKRLCSSSYCNRMACCKAGMISVLVDLLSQHSKFQLKSMGHVISLLERLGSLSITAAELKQLIGLMKRDSQGKQFPFMTRLMRAISTMARRDGICGPLYFFDIQQASDVISLPGIRKWPGPVFSFFTFLCLDPVPNVGNEGLTTSSYRRLLYNISSSNGCGLEAFIGSDFYLTVASFNKKEYSTVRATELALNDGHWHSVAVVHVPGRRFSGSPGHVYIYIDGKVRTSVAFKFPTLAEPIMSCKVGSPGHRAPAPISTENFLEGLAEPKKASPLKSIFGLAGRGSEAVISHGPGVCTLEGGTQDETWGPTVCLYGQLEMVCVFHQVLQPDQVKALSQLGSNPLFHFSEDPALADLPAKLVVRYSAKAYKGNVCSDISPYQNHGTFSGNCCVNWDIKDVINCLGGIQVLFPLLENLDQSHQGTLPLESPASPTKLEAEELDLDDWTAVSSPTSTSPDVNLDHNPLAAFITMLRHMLKEKPVNKDTFVRSHGAAILGALMQKLPGDLIDINVLMSVQYLIEECSEHTQSLSTKPTILQHVYHYILLDFSLWSHTQFAVRIGHIQYVSTIIKDDRKFFRKKYGVQYILDIIRTYYISSEVSGLNEEDSKTIRVSLFNLIKFYMTSSVHVEELHQVMAFILAIKESSLLVEAMDLLIAMLENRSRKHDQLILLLYEPDQAELLYKLLTYPYQPIIFYEKVIKILYILLKSERVYEKNKSRLRLSEFGYWGLVNSMNSYEISAPMIKRFLEQVSFTESAQTYSAILAVLSLVHNSGLDIKSVASRQLLSIIVSKPGAAKGLAKQLAWQENITRLLTLERQRGFSVGSISSTHQVSTSHQSKSEGRINISTSEKPGYVNISSSEQPGYVNISSSEQPLLPSSLREPPQDQETFPSVPYIPELNHQPFHSSPHPDVSSSIVTKNIEANSVIPVSVSSSRNTDAGSVIPVSDSVLSTAPVTATLDGQSVTLPCLLSSPANIPGCDHSQTNSSHHYSTAPDEPSGVPPRPCELNIPSSVSTQLSNSDVETLNSGTAEESIEDLLLATDLTPITPMYMKRTFYELGTSEDEDANCLQGSQSSNASVEDLLQDTFFNETFSRGVSFSSSTTSLTSSYYEGDSALGNSHSSIDMLGNSSRSNSVGDIRRRQSADTVFESDEAVNRMSAVLRGEGFKQVLNQIGVELSDTLEQKEELCQNVLVALLTVMWKGVEGSSTQAWKERCQVFTWIDDLADSYLLIRPAQEIKRRLLEMLLSSCTIDIRNSLGPVSATSQSSENAIRLIHLVQGFLTDPDVSAERFSVTLLEDVMALLDALAVWETDSSVAWTDLVHRGFSVLLAFSKHPDLNLASSATVKLHSLVQTKLISSSAEASFILGTLNIMISKAIDANTDSYVYLMPVLRALIDKGQELLTINTQLPHLPKTSMSSTFFDDFKTYVYSEEWQRFISDYVRPQMIHFMESNFEEGAQLLTLFWAECREEMMMTSRKHQREVLASRSRFKKQIEEVFTKRVDHENRRFMNTLTQQKNQNLISLGHWKDAKRFLTGERGTWRQKGQKVYWKLSNQENFARMKVKLMQNFNFDNHLNASRLRDNIGVTDTDNLLRLEELKSVRKALVSRENIADDTLEDEEWSAISASSSNLEENVGKEKLVISADCELVTVVSEIRGRLEVTTTHVYFFDSNPFKDEAGEDFKWPLSRLREIHLRRYNLRRNALEVFLIDQTNYFISFPEKGMRNKVYSRIVSLRPINLIYKGQRSPADLLRASGLTQKWINREISNFEYLMQLNTIAGRTYNDLSQYPVFPWILVDYTSKHLDLENPNVFRDLSKPIGVVNPKRELEVREKFDTFEDPSGVIEKFHYGTHYSNAASVMHYLVRVEPFTTLHTQLQSGKFDVADRQFHSIPASFSGLMDNPNDVKELIPEFFYFPEFLVNLNGFDLGLLQVTMEPVNDVKLPPWASTPEEFIYKHRQALESEFVSSNLHKWIDLIFGYKQKGPAAVEALNVFYYVTYEGAVDLDAIQDLKERASVEGMIRNFGQTPTQLLKEPHPKRLTFDEALARNAKMWRPMNLFYFVQDLKPFFVEVSNERDPLVFVSVPKCQSRSILQQGMPDSLITVTEEGVIGVHGWLPFDKAVPYYYTFDKDSSISNPKTKKFLGSPFAPGLKIQAKLFVVSHDAKLLFSGGHWDNSLQVYNLNRAKTISHLIRHMDIITCLAIDSCGRHLVTGSRDTTCIVWEIIQQAGVSVTLNPKPLQTLYGHDSEVTMAHISTELDLVVSASKDGTVILHTVLKGDYTMTLRAPSQLGWTLDIPNMVVSDTGQIVLYCLEMEKQTGEGRKRQQERHCLHLYSVNGKHLFSQPLEHGLNDMCMSGDHLILATCSGQLVIMETFGLKPLNALDLKVPVQCLGMSNLHSHILAGLSDGKLIIVCRKS